MVTIPESEAFKTLRSAIDDLQSDYFIQKNGYWQGIKTKSDPSKKSTDCESWDDMSLNLVGLSEEIAVNVYDGPRGKGYIIQIIAEKDGNKYIRKIVFGPETERNCGWILIDTDS